ncbi:Bax inhibitor-1/YccA family protein [Leuconostoc fallax]|uniref:Bax inhibitor-1/YccA family protein n=1 Tax=Leuconostoc fallax TaxID=1251 RepID=UPI0020909121|nr:Bax inhibitor-1/YccA family protein [Leuconostoc fallax]MCO6183939.1 Bax inhibitor-1/YccA family protein [Leuconostoc fallax]
MNNYDFNTRRDVTGVDEDMRAFFKQTYSYMALAVLITGITGYIVKSFFWEQIASLIYGNAIGVIGLIGVQFLLIFMIGRNTLKNTANAFGLLMTFAVVEGLTTGVLLGLYTTASILGVFAATAAVFGGMSAYGLMTKRNLGGLRQALFGLLVGLIVASLINMFFPNGIVNLLISYVAVVVFSLYTAYDNQRLKLMYAQTAGQMDTTGLAINGALSLYLDFINLFFYLLRLFGVMNTRD